MNRRDTVFALAALGAAPLIARAQAPQHARVGYLSSPPNLLFFLPLFVSALRKVGWVEGRNLILEKRVSGGTPERLREMATELVRLEVQVIVLNDYELEFARRASHQIPIVVTSMLDPVNAGLATSLAHPTGNVTGLLWADPTLSAKSMQILKELIPSIRRVGSIYEAGTEIRAEPFFKAAESAGRQLGVDYYRLPVRTAKDIDAALAEAKKKHVDALRVSDAGIVAVEEARILKFASSSLLPTSYTSPGPVYRGGLISYAPNLMGRASRAAAMVDKILKGAKPADLPFEYPTQYDLVINLKTAKALRLAIPQALLLRADKVIE